jgi:ankyrin repeat protein
MGADINFQDDEGFTVLMDAVYDDKPSVVKILLEAGADKNLKNSDGRSALDIAIMLINDDKWKKRTFCRNSGLIIIL